MGEDRLAHEAKTVVTTTGAQELYGQHNNTAHCSGEGATQARQLQAPPAPDLRGYTLYASPKPVPEELLREPSGTSIAAPSSVLDEENGRTYAVHETGQYSMPNDAVCLFVSVVPSKTRPGSRWHVCPNNS